MAPTLSKLATYTSAISTAAVLYVIYKRTQDSKYVRASFERPSHERKRPAVAVNATFFKKLWQLYCICNPGILTPETGFIVMVAVMMLLRTYCDLWMIANTTMMERIIISRNRKEFPVGLLKFLTAMVPIALVNNLLKYGLTELSLRFRTRLTKHLFKQYLKGFTYYKITNLDNRISNVDQVLTQDLEKFCNSLSELYSNISKPLLDICIYANKLSGAIGIQGPFSMLLYLAISGVVLTALRKPTGRFTVHEQRLEGEFRFVNSRLITNSEEIAFYQGNQHEAGVISHTYSRLENLLRRSMQFRFSMGIIDHIIAKYFATVVGFLVVSRPFLNPNTPDFVGKSQDELMEAYYKAGRMLMAMAMAVGRLVLAGRELTRLAGFTSRMTDLLEVLNDLNQGKYSRTMVNTKDAEDTTLKPNSGTIIEQDHIILFKDVPIVTPNGDVLIKSLNMEVKSGMNVLVCGPNGCGKSSLFRILGELWPLFGGTLYKPAKEKLFYVPQRPYMTLGTLRDQVIYPHSLEQCREKGISDDILFEFLEKVHLGYLVEREGGWDAVQDWMDVLSGGEKQRIAMARLFYHKPQFAILDECTSAVSVDVEGFMYTHCRDIGISLFTVSHRKSLWKYHEYVLSFDGRGSYTYLPIEQVDTFGS